MKGASSFVRMLQKRRALSRAEKETEWFFREMGGRVPNPGEGPDYARPAAEAIDRWLSSIPSFHRGALALRYETREWPARLEGEFGEWTSLIVRLEGARLADGVRSPVQLERLAVRNLEEAIASCERRRKAVEGTHRESVPLTPRERRVLRRSWRARRHVRAAIRAYARARGTAPYVLPRDLALDGSDE